MDPFFQAKYAHQIGKINSAYLADVNATYNSNYKKQKDNSAFQRAFEFREREKASMNALAEENEHLRNQLNKETKRSKYFAGAILDINSKLAKYGGSTCNSGSASDGSVPPVPTPREDEGK
jgi:hypothetical protein